MNERLKELMLEAGYVAPELAPRAQRLAELIIEECRANPKVYLLEKMYRGFPAAEWELYGWTSDLSVAQKWQEQSNRDELHHFKDLYFQKHIKEIE